MNARDLVTALANPTNFKNPAVLAKLLELFPSGRAAISTFRETPMCGSCRAGLIKLFDAEPQKAEQLLQLVVPGSAFEVATETDQAKQPTMAKLSIAGRVDTIDDSDEAYSAHIQKLFREGTVYYSGLSVRPIGNGKIKIYFY